MDVQSYLFDRQIWTLEKANHQIQSLNLKTIFPPSNYSRFFRFQIHPEENFQEIVFRNNQGRGIAYLVGYY